MDDLCLIRRDDATGKYSWPEPEDAMLEIRRFCPLDGTMLGICLRGNEGLHVPGAHFFAKPEKKALELLGRASHPEKQP